MNTLESLRTWALGMEKRAANPRIEVKDVLFCVQYEFYQRDGSYSIIDENLHAKSGYQACEDFINSLKPGERKRIRIIAVAPVVGYLVDDKHGDRLTV